MQKHKRSSWPVKFTLRAKSPRKGHNKALEGMLSGLSTHNPYIQLKRVALKERAKLISALRSVHVNNKSQEQFSVKPESIKFKGFGKKVYVDRLIGGLARLNGYEIKCDVSLNVGKIKFKQK